LTVRLREIERGKMREGYIPYCAYWSTPFARWQGSFAHLQALKFGAPTTKTELARRRVLAKSTDPGRAVLIEKYIGAYLTTDTVSVWHALESKPRQSYPRRAC
jgi:hypothetical protein